MTITLSISPCRNCAIKLSYCFDVCKELDQYKELALQTKLYGQTIYPESESPKTGRFWTKEQLNSGCGDETKMAIEIAETYAQTPEYYGSTWCCSCRKHLPVNEFQWLDGTEVGS